MALIVAMMAAALVAEATSASAAGAPRPSVASASPGDVDSAPGQVVSFTVKAKNTKKRRSRAASLVFLWSENGSAKGAETVGTGTIPPLRRKSTSRLPFSVTVPVGSDDDDYRLLVCTPRAGRSPNCHDSIKVDVDTDDRASSSSTPSPSPSCANTTALPSRVLNLANWKLTLPTDVNNNDVADEVIQPQLNSFVDPCWFRVDTTGAGVTFRANAGGATTSGSDYPRSELREMNGSSLAAWDPKAGQNVMTVTEAITATPMVKPDVVAAQIHDGSDDVLQVRLEGSRLFVESDGNFVGSLNDNYVLGTPFTAVITSNSSGISVTFNGTPKVTNFRPSGAGSRWYFKAGCYTQSNLSRGDAATAYGEVVVYGLQVTH